MKTDHDIRRANPGDWPAVNALLAAAALPTDDLDANRIVDFFVACAADVVFGAVSVEPHGECGLLRSLVIDETQRRGGVGKSLLIAAERHAAANGIRDLWLLTTDAANYFTRYGYVQRDRGDAPDAIRNTAQFSGLCPGSATLMSRSLPAS